MSSANRTLPLNSLNHVSRVCANVEASRDFYRDVLGFVEIKRPSSFEFEGSWLFNYGIGIHLIEGVPLPRSRVINPKADHLSFQSNSLQEVELRLEEANIPYVKAFVEEGGIRICQLFFHDPDGNMIEVCNCDCLPVLPLSCKQISVCEHNLLCEAWSEDSGSCASSQFQQPLAASSQFQQPLANTQ